MMDETAVYRETTVNSLLPTNTGCRVLIVLLLWWLPVSHEGRSKHVISFFDNKLIKENQKPKEYSVFKSSKIYILRQRFIVLLFSWFFNLILTSFYFSQAFNNFHPNTFETFRL